MPKVQSIPLDGDQVYTGFIEPFMNHTSSAGDVDWDTWCEKLPAPTHSDVAEKGRLRVEEVSVYRGSLSIAGGLEIHDGGILVVLGDLHVAGGVFAASRDYLAIVVRGRLCVDRLYVTGDVIAVGGIKAELWWGRGNNYSTCAPKLETDTYITERRGDVIDTCAANLRLEASDLPKHYENLDPRSYESISDFIRLVRMPIASSESEPGEREVLQAKLEAGWALPARRDRIKALRLVYATIKRGRLADLGEALVSVIERKAMDAGDWSIHEELELLADLRRPDLLESLPSQWLTGCQGRIPSLLARARK